ncbi:hypothetical protein [Actinomadura sp. WMMA1423]|uniref:hypothetical protein n=1 Tax=Actinomadura sp. WMMA1423 TaxID=2591108 RepID=UPI001146CC00|nr:hypothetical protein [Actinomadura sp. WMMA1423]
MSLSNRARNTRVLPAVLAWLIVIAAVWGVWWTQPEATITTATGVITAANAIAALLFLVALRCPRLRRTAGVRRAGRAEVAASLARYQKEIIRIAIYPTLGTMAMLLAFGLNQDLVVKAENLDWTALSVPLLLGAVGFCYIKTAEAIRSARRKATSDVPHPVLSVVAGSLLTAVVSLLALPSVGLATFLTWQMVLACAIAGATTFVAELITLWAVSTTKN